jgi:hypothetical protein
MVSSVLEPATFRLVAYIYIGEKTPVSEHCLKQEQTARRSPTVTLGHDLPIHSLTPISAHVTLSSPPNP